MKVFGLDKNGRVINESLDEDFFGKIYNGLKDIREELMEYVDDNYYEQSLTHDKTNISKEEVECWEEVYKQVTNALKALVKLARLSKGK